MAQLDKILQSMIQHRADELLLREDEGAVFKVDGAEKPVAKPLTGPQVVALIKEIAPPQASVSIDARVPAKVQY